MQCANKCEKSSLHTIQCKKSCFMHLKATYFREMHLTARKFSRDASDGKKIFAWCNSQHKLFAGCNCLRTQCKKSCLMHLKATYFREMHLMARTFLRDVTHSRNFLPAATACEFSLAPNCRFQISFQIVLSSTSLRLFLLYRVVPSDQKVFGSSKDSYKNLRLYTFRFEILVNVCWLFRQQMILYKICIMKKCIYLDTRKSIFWYIRGFAHEIMIPGHYIIGNESYNTPLNFPKDSEWNFKSENKIFNILNFRLKIW